MRICLLLLPALLLVVTALPISPAEAGKPPTPTPVYVDRIWGDILCDGQVDAPDAIRVLEWVAQTFSTYPPQNCPSVVYGMAIEGFDDDQRWGDMDCSGTSVTMGVDALDALTILRAAASYLPNSSNDCPTIGQTYSVAILGK